MPPLILELIPLAVASALIPLPLIVTVLLLRSSPGGAAAWVGGQAVTRIAQGVVLALVLDAAYTASDGSAKSGPVISAVLVVLAILFYVAAARKALHAPDDDAPPPSWMETLSTAPAGRAFVMGGGFMVISVKFWVVTLGAVGAIADAGLEPASSAAAYLGFTVLALSLQALLVALAVLAPARAGALLAQVAGLLERYSRPLLIAVGLLFGTIFLLEGLAGLGVL